MILLTSLSTGSCFGKGAYGPQDSTKITILDIRVVFFEPIYTDLCKFQIKGRSALHEPSDTHRLPTNIGQRREEPGKEGRPRAHDQDT